MASPSPDQGLGAQAAFAAGLVVALQCLAADRGLWKAVPAQARATSNGHA